MKNEGLPKERVVITLPKGVISDKEVELPLKILAIGPYTNNDNKKPVADRIPQNINNKDFNKVLAGHNITIDTQVKNKLSSDSEYRNVRFTIERWGDFKPDGIIEKDPSMKELKDLRNALASLKVPMANTENFKKELNNAVKNEENRERILKLIGLAKEGGK